MNITPLVMETVKLRMAASDARARAERCLTATESQRLQQYASALESRAAELNAIVADALDAVIAAPAIA